MLAWHLQQFYLRTIRTLSGCARSTSTHMQTECAWYFCCQTKRESQWVTDPEKKDRRKKKKTGALVLLEKSAHTLICCTWVMQCTVINILFKICTCAVPWEWLWLEGCEINNIKRHQDLESAVYCLAPGQMCYRRSLGAEPVFSAG